MRKLLLIFAFACFALAKETILVSIAPQSYFVKAIAHDAVDVVTLVPPGASPATYSLRPSQLAAIKKAQIYLTIGVPFEKAQLRRIKGANPHLRILDSTKYIRKLPMQAHHHHTEHEHEGLDPHVWMAPNLATQLARTTLEALITIKPSGAKEFLENYRRLVAKIAAIDAKIYGLMLHSKRKAFLVYHPSFGYFARSYGLKQLAIESEGKEPTMQELSRLIQKAKKLGIKTIFIEPQFPKRSAKFIAAKLGAKIEIIDPLAPDWDQNILKVARAIAGD